MARYGQRPENALKRANEFIEVGKPARALDTLQEVFRNKKWAYNWSESILEPIMFKYLDLCVELKKSHIAKEGLFQYRNMFQSVNVGSLENVIRGYLRMAEEKTENAREQSAQAVIDIDDLDNLATPESILLSAVSGEDAQDRSDRTILTPWVKFLWESYCQCLELLRTNAHVENLYHDIARMAFQFCLKYNRKTEFRKLCDKLRKHLEDICKLPAQVANVSMQKPETQQLNLETRLHQLDFAIQMELWQEAYKAIEDIHNLMNMSKKMPVPKTMANYYQKLAMVFWKAGNYLFHAAALFKLFQLSKEMKKNITQEELQRMACRVLIATLSIPLPSAHPEFDRFIETDKSPLEKAQRLAVLLGLFQPPTRASLLKDLVRVNVVNLASPQLQDLYNWLEVDFHPLLLCSRVQTVIQSLQVEENSLQQYIPALQDVTLVRLVRQVAQVYQTIEFARLIELAKFTDEFHFERLLVDCVRHNDMQIRIDHAKRCVHFGMDLSESQREDKPEGPTLQVMPSEQVRNQLVNMATVLNRAISVINPNKKRVEREKVRSMLVKHYHENKLQEHQKILQRHKIIEDRKEYIERLNTVREEEEHRRLEELVRQQALAEQKRLEHEREEREKKRALNEIQQIKDRHLKEKLQQISQTGHGQKILKKLDEDDIKKLDADQIAAKEAEELQKERRELQAKLKSQEKKVDYFERAKRLEEIPLLQASMKERQLQDQAFWEQQEKDRIAAAVEERKLAVATRDRLVRMKPDKDIFIEKLKNERNIVYEDKLNEFEVLLAEERKKRLAERKVKRKEERRLRYIREKEEEEERKLEEQRRKEEEELQRIEETARKEKEERERAQKEESEKRHKEQQEMLDRVAAKQRQRMEEVERRLAEERDTGREKPKESAWRTKAGSEREGPPKRAEEGERRTTTDERDAGREKPKDSAWRRSKPTAEREAAPKRAEGGGDSWRRGGDRAAGAENNTKSEEGPVKKVEAWMSRNSRPAVGGAADETAAPPRKSDAWRRGGKGNEDGAPPAREERRFESRDNEDKDLRPPREERGGDRDDRFRRGGDRDNRDERGGGRDRDERGGSSWRSAGRPRNDEEGGARRGRNDEDGGGMRRGRNDDDGGMRRGRNEEDGGMRRGGRNDEDGGMRRGPAPSRGPREGGADWRSAAPRRDDGPPRKQPEERRAPPPKENSAPREQTQSEEEEGGWAEVKRR